MAKNKLAKFAELDQLKYFSVSIFQMRENGYTFLIEGLGERGSLIMIGPNSWSLAV